MGRFPVFAAAALALCAAAPCAAEPLTYALPEETATLLPGPGREAAQNNCLSCHSADYILTQPPGLGRAFWEAEVKKMIASYRAPIDAADARAIVDYLAATY